MAERILMNEYKSLAQEKWVNIEVSGLSLAWCSRNTESVLTRRGAQLNEDDIFNWNIGLIVLNPDSLYYGGYFKAKMTFPKNYPYSPPGKKPLPVNHWWSLVLTTSRI